MRFPFARFIVEGRSMEPAFCEGQYVLARRDAYAKHDPAPGDVVIMRDPRDTTHLMIKRIAASSEQNQFFVLGDNPSRSTDSRAFGSIGKESIFGKVVLRA